MPDPTLSEAIQEAYAHAPSDAIILHTLELLRHGYWNNPYEIEARAAEAGQKGAV